MAIIDLLWKIPAVIILGYSGMIFHELCHYILGWVSRGEPKFSKFRYRLPTQIDFESPHKMSNAGVRLSGGIVILWPLLTFFLAGYTAAKGTYGLFPLIVSFAGASAVSWFDLFAASEPELWKQFTSGEPISRKELDEQRQ